MGLYWNVWIIVLAPSYEKIITSDLVNLGFEVSAISACGKVNANPSENSGVTLAYRICDPKGHAPAIINDMVTDVLAKNKMLYFGLVISEADKMCSWRASNIYYPKDKKAKEPILN